MMINSTDFSYEDALSFLVEVREDWLEGWNSIDRKKKPQQTNTANRTNIILIIYCNGYDQI